MYSRTVIKIGPRRKGVAMLMSDAVKVAALIILAAFCLDVGCWIVSAAGF